MKTNINLFWILAAFFALLAAVYVVWEIIAIGRVEWVGAVAISLCAVLSMFIAFYLRLVYRNQGGELAEDRLDAEIDDGEAEQGFFSPWSWWPVALAGAAAIAGELKCVPLLTTLELGSSYRCPGPLLRLAR